MKKLITTTAVSLVLAGCGTLTNEDNVPISLSFSDGSSGACVYANKRMNGETAIPATIMVRRSDDELRLNCETSDGRIARASIPSTIGAKHIASAAFLDFGITDAITDKSREYPPSFVIPVVKQ